MDIWDKRYILSQMSMGQPNSGPNVPLSHSNVPVALKIWTFGPNVLFWGTGADWTSGLRKISDGHNGPHGPNGPSGPSVPVSPGPGTYIPTRDIWAKSPDFEGHR